MAKKLYDLAVKTGEYRNSAGETKGRYQNVGAILEGDNGKFIMLAKWFNPAGVVDARGGESIVLSMFQPKDNESAPAPQTRHQEQKSNGYAPSDEIPF